MTPVVIGQINDAQRAVLDSASTKRITVVTGPPGTGKSELLANLAATAACAGRTMLIASTNNQAVDEVVERCNAQIAGLVMRTGNQEYKQRQIDALAALLQPGAGPTRASVTAAAAAHSLALAQDDRARRNAKDQAELEQQLARCGRKRRGVEATLAELGIGVPPALGAADDAALTKWRSKTGKAARSTLFRAYRRRRLLRSLAVEASGDRLDAACSALHEYVSSECTWRELRNVPQRSDSNLSTDLSATAQQVRAASIDLASAHTAVGVAESRQLIQELQGALTSRAGSTWSIVLRLLPQLRVWAVSSLSARNFPPRAGLFDLVVIDEASQCSIAAILPLLFRAKAAVIVGDPMQLRHIAGLRPDQDAALSDALGLDPAWLSEHRVTYQRHSGFDAWEARAGESMLLDEHYRCHPHIAAIADSLFYAPRGKPLTILTDTRAQLAVPARTRSDRGRPGGRRRRP
jgi:hypothetical protein